MKRLLKAFAIFVAAIFLIAGSIAGAYVLWPLETFNLLMVKDPARLLARGIAYGAHPRQIYDLFAPETGKNLPVLVFVHGGAWDSGSKDGYDFVGHAFASRGYLTAMVTYRLVPEVHYPGFVEDTAAAIEHVRKTAAGYGGDPSRVYLVGHSAGAYNVIQSVLNPAFKLDRQSIRAMAGLAAPLIFPPSGYPVIEKAFGKYTPFEDTQPERYLAPATPPLLLIHGADDETVKAQGSEAFHALAVNAGVEAELRIHPGTNHISILGDLSWPFRWRSPTFANIIEFFERHP